MIPKIDLWKPFVRLRMSTELRRLQELVDQVRSDLADVRQLLFVLHEQVRSRIHATSEAATCYSLSCVKEASDSYLPEQDSSPFNLP